MNIKRPENLENEINEEFEAFLKNDQDPIVQAINRNSISNITIEDKEFLLDQNRTVDADVFKTADWIKELRKNATYFANGAGTDSLYASYFFIQLYETLENGMPHFKNRLEVYVRVKSFVSVPPGYLENISEILAKLGKTAASFSKEEYEVLEFLRNYYAHFQINKYRAQYSVKNGTHSLDLNGEPRRVVRLRINNWIEGFGGNPALMAKHFASKISDSLEELEKLIITWSKYQ